MKLDRFRLLTADEKDHIYQEIVDNCELQADCWVWKGAKDSAGYGVKYIQGKMRTVSRFMLAYTSRESMNVKADACHIEECPLRTCCNPAHLFWGTHGENCLEREATRFRFGANSRKSKARSLASSSGVTAMAETQMPCFLDNLTSS
jgi:hypothetical protein